MKNKEKQIKIITKLMVALLCLSFIRACLNVRIKEQEREYNQQIEYFEELGLLKDMRKTEQKTKKQD